MFDWCLIFSAVHQEVQDIYLKAVQMNQGGIDADVQVTCFKTQKEAVHSNSVSIQIQKEAVILMLVSFKAWKEAAV